MMSWVEVPGRKISAMPDFFEGGDVGAGDDAANEDGDVVHAFFVEEFHELGTEGVVGAGEDGEADDVDIFLDGGGGDHLRGLAEAGVDHFHAGVAEGAGDDFGAAVVAVQSGLGNQTLIFFSGIPLSSLCASSVPSVFNPLQSL